MELGGASGDLEAVCREQRRLGYHAAARKRIARVVAPGFAGIGVDLDERLRWG